MLQHNTLYHIKIVLQMYLLFGMGQIVNLNSGGVIRYRYHIDINII